MGVLFVYRSYDVNTGGLAIGLDRTVVSMMHCGCIDPGSIPGLVINKFCYMGAEHGIASTLDKNIFAQVPK